MEIKNEIFNTKILSIISLKDIRNLKTDSLLAENFGPAYVMEINTISLNPFKYFGNSAIDRFIYLLIQIFQIQNNDEKFSFNYISLKFFVAFY